MLDFVARELEGRILTVSSISAFVAAEKAAVASEEDRKLMVNLVYIMTCVETDAARSAFLKKLRARLQAPERTDAEVERRDRTRLISISMDVSGSTAVKESIRRRARDAQELTRWYEAYHSEFLWLEWRFYSALFQAVAGDVGLDWKQAFVVKGIGDEIWLLYEVSGPRHDFVTQRLPEILGSEGRGTTIASAM